MKPTKPINGQGLSKLMVEYNFGTLGIDEFSFGNYMIQENKKLL